MKSRMIASALGLVLTLVMSASWGQRRGTILPTGLGILPVSESGATVKGTCPAGSTEFSKPEFPNFLSGPESGVVSATYSVWDPATEAYIDVTVTLTYYSDRDPDRDRRNSFDFVITNGSVSKLVVKRSDGLIYDYDPAVPADTGLNKQQGGAAEISHLEFCLNPPVEVVSNTSTAENCLEGVDEIPQGELGVGGCNPSGSQLFEIPNELDLANQLDGKTVTQVLAPSFQQYRSAQCDSEFVALDPRVDETTGEVIAASNLDLSTLFDLSGFFPPPAVAPEIILRADAVGSPCLALVVGNNNFEFVDLEVPSAEDSVFTVTQLAANVAGMYIFPEIGPLNTDPASSDYQPDLRWVEQAAYQPKDRFLLIEELASLFTFDVFNPPRTRTYTGSFYPLNTREECLFLDPFLDPSDGALYFEAVLQCKIDLAVGYFERLEEALVEADAFGNLVSPSLNRLLRDHSRALSMIKTRGWDRAISRLNDLRVQVVNGEWIVDFRNDPGNVVMRLDNLIWRTEQLKIADEALGAMP